MVITEFNPYTEQTHSIDWYRVNLTWFLFLLNHYYNNPDVYPVITTAFERDGVWHIVSPLNGEAVEMGDSADKAIEGINHSRLAQGTRATRVNTSYLIQPPEWVFFSALEDDLIGREWIPFMYDGDRDIAESHPCDYCGSQDVKGKGYTKRGRDIEPAYRAFAVCSTCGHYQEF